MVFFFSLATAISLWQAFSEISGIITMFYVVRTLSPYTEYEFYVIAVNNIGRGPPSSPATCTTGETGISHRVQHPDSPTLPHHHPHAYLVTESIPSSSNAPIAKSIHIFISEPEQHRGFLPPIFFLFFDIKRTGISFPCFMFSQAHQTANTIY